MTTATAATSTTAAPARAAHHRRLPRSIINLRPPARSPDVRNGEPVCPPEKARGPPGDPSQPGPVAAPPPCSPATGAIAVPAHRVRPDGRVQAGHQPPAEQEEAEEHRRDRDERGVGALPG